MGIMGISNKVLSQMQVFYPLLKIKNDKHTCVVLV